jgi:hypothetical protein
LSASTNAPEGSGLSISIAPSQIGAPGAGEATVTIRTDANTFPADYIATIYATSGEQVTASSFVIRVECTPPFILGTDQPKSVAGLTSGAQTTLEVKPSGSGPFLYQWYRGQPGMTNNPVQAENNPKFVLTARENGPYWVRVRNACGSVDSSAATVTVIGQPVASRRGSRP